MFDRIFESSPTENPFILYSSEHIMTIFILFFGIFLLFLLRKKLSEKITGMIFLSVMLFFEIGFHIWLITKKLWDVSFALPLQLCSVSLILCILLLITENKNLFEIVYFIGIAGAIQAIVTPDLFYNFPHFRFFHFFINHCLIIWTCLFYIWTKEFRITFLSIFKSLLFLHIAALIAFMANKFTGGNYMFLAGKPKGRSALDFLGEYPWYILSLEGVAVIMFFIMYLPFVKSSHNLK